MQMPIERSLVHGVAVAECGAHPTSCGPAYGMDIAHLRDYSAAAKGEWQAYVERFVVGKDLDAYVAEVGGAKAIAALPLPIF